jgi:two-component system phosphate regulon response regulator PhoB
MYRLLHIGPPASTHIRLQTELMNRYALEQTGDTGTALRIIRSHRPDLILLSSRVVQGLQFISQLKAHNDVHDIPIIYLTETDNEDERIAALNAGADDCLANMFSLRESTARIEARLRRYNSTVNGRIHYDVFCLDPDSFTLTIQGESVNISPTEFRLLRFFLDNPGRAFNRRQILDKVWGRGTCIEERTIDAHVRRLRKLLAYYNCERYIQTIRSIGYRFEAPH